MKINKKLMTVLAAAIFGAGLGAVLGYGPLLRYKSGGVLKMGLDTAEYKRVSELAMDSHHIRAFATWSPPRGFDTIRLDQMIGSIARQNWLTAVPRVSKVDERELPDVLLQQERDKLTGGGEPLYVYLGVALSYTAATPKDAAEVATWLGTYIKDTATLEALRQLVAEWSAETAQFSDRAVESRLKYQFDLRQIKTRADAFKQIVHNYPEAARGDVSQVIDVRRDNEKFMSPMAQLIGAEAEGIEVKEKLKQLDRQAEEEALLDEFVKQARVALSTAHGGGDGLKKINAVISHFQEGHISEAQQQKLSAIAVQVTTVASRFQTSTRFLARPTLPSTSQKPSPKVLMVFLSAFAALLAGAFVWRDMLNVFLVGRTEAMQA